MNRVALGYNRFLNVNGAPLATVNQDWAGKIGVENTSPVWFPDMNFTGSEWQGGKYGKLGVGYYGPGANGSWAVMDDLTYIKGAHSIHVGYQYMNYYYNDRSYPGSGSFSFSPRSTGAPGNLADTGNSVASFLLGAVNSASRGIPTLSTGMRQPYHAVYAADDWKITPKLTMNFGLRWEIIPPFFERTGRMSYIDLNAPNPEANNLPGAMVFGKKPNSTYWKEFGPRLGFA